MSYIGACPNCGESIDFAAYLPADGVCARCKRRYMVVVPELDGPPAEAVEVMLLAAGGEQGDERELPTAIRLSGTLLLGALSGLLFLFALAIFVTLFMSELGRDAPLSGKAIMIGMALLCLGGAGWIFFLLVASGRARSRS